jgi:tetratricopeptide (TPR) repeat protein
MVKHQSTISEDLLFDKQQVITIVKSALRRLRAKKIQVDNVIHQIEQHGVQMTRSRFEDLFTSRPNRINGAPPSTIIALIHAFFALDHKILSAKEVLTLANAARLPINFCEQLSVHFAHEEWRNAWFDYLPSTQTSFHRSFLIGRNREFSVLLQHLLQEQDHLIISGPPGIGKTVLAQTLIQELEVLMGQNVTFVYAAESFKTYAQFVVHIANALHIKPLHNEPIELRMASILSTQKVRHVFIDDMHTDDHATHISILRTFSQQFPKVRFIITTRERNQFDELRQSYEHVLTPLDDSQINSAAMQLFIHTLTINGITINDVNKSTLLTICQRAKGNPQQIQLLATMRSIEEIHTNSQSYTQLLDTLSVREFSIIRLLLEARGPLSTTFLSFYLRHTEHNVTLHTPEILDRLVNRGLLTVVMIYSQKNLVVNQQLLQNAVNDTTDNNLDTALLLRKIAQMARSIHVRNYHELTNHDIERIAHLLERLHYHNEYLEDICHVIVAWQNLWMHANLTAPMISLIERCTVQFTTPNRMLVDLYLVNGRLHDHRGNTQSALICLQQAMDTLDQPQSVKWAEIMLDYVDIQSRQSMFSHTNAIETINQICEILHTDQQHYLLGIAHNILSKTYATQNNLERAFTSSYSALQFFREYELSIGHIDALLQRSLIYMYSGDYDIANGILQGLIQQIRPYKLPYLLATAELRIAGIHALLRNVEAARIHLTQAFQTLHRIGSAHEILMVADVYSLICYRQARFVEAYQINKASSYLREKLDLPRITYIERLVEDKRQKILSTVSAEIQATPVNLTIYDLIDRLWGYFDTKSLQTDLNTP